MLITPNWREWYHFRHQQECSKPGTAFEGYVSSVLSRFHDDFVNPDPAGRLGDYGCDGLAESGTRFYACFGARPGRNVERELADKIVSDFSRALEKWSCFDTWIFVTNTQVGPEALKAFTSLQQAHGPHAARPLTLRLWRPEDLWNEVVGTLSDATLNELFPGAPGIEHIELADLLPLLDTLSSGEGPPETGAPVRPVPPSKMDFNKLAATSRMELNAGRLLAPRIDVWYETFSDPSLYDSHGEAFRALYSNIRAITDEPAEILERLYVSLAGANFRMDGVRANAAYAVVAYFFDSCHIFRTPPPELADPKNTGPDMEVPGAAAN